MHGQILRYFPAGRITRFAKSSFTRWANCCDGQDESTLANIPFTFRIICSGVKKNPHGNAHHPKTPELTTADSFALTPQRWQLTC